MSVMLETCFDFTCRSALSQSQWHDEAFETVANTKVQTLHSDSEYSHHHPTDENKQANKNKQAIQGNPFVTSIPQFHHLLAHDSRKFIHL